MNESKEVLVGGIVCLQSMQYLILIREESANARKERKIHEEEFYSDVKAVLDVSSSFSLLTFIIYYLVTYRRKN